MEYRRLGSLTRRKIGYGIVQPGHNEVHGVPVIKVNNLISGLRNIEELDKTSVENDKKYSRTKLHGGELIISVVGTTGKTAIVPSSFAGCNLVRATALIDIIDPIQALFIKYYIDSPIGQSYICSNLNTTVQPTLNIKSLIDMPIPLFSADRMNRIVEILSSLDDKIEVNRRINENLEQQAQALFKSWFVDFEPFKDGNFVDSELGMIPEGWEVHEIGEVSELTVGGDKPKVFSKIITDECTIPIYSNGIEHDGLYGYTNSARINEDSVTISARGTIGFVCLRKSPYFPIVRLISLLPRLESLSAEYLYLWAKNQNIMGVGTTQQQLTVPNFRIQKIVIPDIKVRKSFNKVIRTFFSKIEANKKENNNISNLRDALLPKLMSGEIEIKD